jgi:hypothetical protein
MTSADEMTSQNDLMSDPSADRYFKILYHVRSRLWTICPCLDQGPIRHKDGPPTNLVNTVMIFSFIPTNTWSLVHIDVGILPNIAATSRRILMRTNVHQNFEDEKTQNRLFRIEPLGQYAWGLVTGG